MVSAMGGCITSSIKQGRYQEVLLRYESPSTSHDAIRGVPSGSTVNDIMSFRLVKALSAICFAFNMGETPYFKTIPLRQYG